MLFHSIETTTAADPSQRNVDVYVMDINGSYFRDVTRSPALFESVPDWGPRAG
jgi:hypothetical protein